MHARFRFFHLMLISMKLRMDQCINEWPPSPMCFFTGRTVVFGTMIGVSIIGHAISTRRSAYSRMQEEGAERRRRGIRLAEITMSLLMILHLSHLAHSLATHTFNYIFAVGHTVAALFWLVTVLSWGCCRRMLPLTRPCVHTTLSLLAAFLLLVPPLLRQDDFFGKKIEFYFYLAEAVLVALSTSTAIVFSDGYKDDASTWSEYTRKFRKMWPFIWPKGMFFLQMRILFCIFLLLGGRVINIALPLYNKWIVDGLATPETFQFSLIFISCALKFLQGNGAMGGFLNTVRSYLWVPVQQHTSKEIQTQLFAHLHNLSLRWHLSRKTGLVLRVMDRGNTSVNSVLNYILFNIFPTIADIFLAVIFFFATFNAYFGVLVFFTMVIYLALTISVTEWRSKFRREMNEKENKSSAMASDSLLNYETVKYYNNEELEGQRFKEAIEDFQHAEWRANASLALLNMLQNGTIGLGMTAGSVLIAYFIQRDRVLSVGDYVLFTTYILQLYSPLNFFGTVYRTIQKSFIDAENMFDLLDEPVEVSDRPDAIEYKTTEGRISVHGLDFAYTQGTPVLHNVSFDVGAGESVALVGRSGSGKSTIIRLLFRLFECPDGTIKYDGRSVQELTMSSLRRQIGIVPQDTVLFNDTIRYNIRFGRPDATDEEVEDAARAAMIHDKILTLPDGYNTLVGERGLRLSGGEKQRVAIARTILKKPRFIFLDEATSALDTHTERAIQACLQQICENRTTVVVAHRLSTIVNATRILVLDKGSVIEAGSHQELLSQNGVYAQMWLSQSTENDSESSSGEGSAIHVS